MAGSNKLASKKTFTLNVLYLLYPDADPLQKERPVRALRKILSRFKCKKRIFYIDNSAEKNYAKQIAENEYELSGDNSLWEFSGWQRGVDFTRKNNLLCDAFLFVNDMFLHNSFFHRRSVDQVALECAVTHNAMIGKPMRPPAAGQVLGNKLIPYVRTHLFLISTKVLEALGSLVSIDQPTAERFFISGYEPDILLFREDAPLSPEIKKFIFSYITSTWHRKKPYEVKNFEALKSKTVSILNAFLLSMRTRRLGYPLISYAKARFLLSGGTSLDQMDEIWFAGVEYYKNNSADPAGSFWLKNIPFYRYLPMKKPTWEKFKDLLEGQNDFPAHL